jgi:16S rRNA (uracil1498-N3)-methyltransferase
MSRYDFAAPRLYVDSDLEAGAQVACSASQSNYLRNVLRLGSGDDILLFNGRDGEWRAELFGSSRRDTQLLVTAQTRGQVAGPDIDYLFAPLKRARLDYMVEKATEMGVASLRPVMTRRTTVERVNLERMRANVVEAAEQCGILRLPEVRPPETLERLLTQWTSSRPLVFCDEDAETPDPIAALAGLRARPLALVIGPEGGFDPGERDLLVSQPFVVRISLGPRILRADTAAVAALALVNAAAGDWR